MQEITIFLYHAREQWQFFLESGAWESTSFASTPHGHLDPVGGLDNSVFFEIKSSNLPFTIVLGMMENRSIWLSEQSLFKVEKFQYSSGHSSIKIFCSIIIDTYFPFLK